MKGLHDRAILRASPDLYLLLDPALVIVDASDAYLRATMTRREDIIGRDVFVAFPEGPEDSPAAIDAIRASFETVVRERAPHTPPIQRYPIQRPAAAGGGFEVRHWQSVNSPVLTDRGEVAYVLHRTTDVTTLVTSETERSDLGRSLRASESREEHVRELLDAAPDAIVNVASDGRIELVNLRTEQMFGYRREELIGKALEMLIPERFRTGHATHLQRFFVTPLSRPMGSRLELFGRRKDGLEIPIEVSLSPYRGVGGHTVSAAIRDTTERHALEAAARLLAERLRSAVESMQDAVALFDRDDRLVLCNTRFSALVAGTDRDAMVGRTYPEILAGWIDIMDFPDDAAREQFRRDRLARRSEDESSVDIRTRDGRTLRIIDRRTAEGGIVKTVWDLTEDQHRETELQEAKATAEAASAAKSDFLSSMSHELRTPLNSILGFAQLLLRDRKEPLGERHKERVEHVLRSGEHLLRLIDDVLDLAKIEAGRISLSVEPVNVSVVLTEVHRLLEPIAHRHGVVIQSLAAEDVPPVIADRTRLVQILMNFGSNAVKYNRADGLIEFRVEIAGAQRIRLVVRDTGIGIPVEQQQRLFQPFHRAGQETGPIEGTGIGLVITRRLAAMMGGTVGFSSTVGVGSEFWVDLPSGRRGSAATATPNAPVEVPRVETARRLVLYVEDNPSNVELMRDVMSSFDNVELVSLPSAELGLDFARARSPDLILMDINLPGMSGLDALHALRASPNTADIPVIALTAAASARDRQRGSDAGFYRYLAKPVNVEELLATIERVFAASNLGAASTP